MADILTLISDLESAEFQHGASQNFWDFLERVDWLVYVRLYASDDRSFTIELDCSNYCEDPIRGRFVDPVTRQCRAEFWPRGNGMFSGWIKFEGSELFICWDQDRAGIQHHGEWRRQEAWKKQKNQIVAYLDFLRRLLHVEAMGYQRRQTGTQP